MSVTRRSSVRRLAVAFVAAGALFVVPAASAATGQFGNTTPGNAFGCPGADFKYGNKHTLGVSGSVTKITAWIRAGATASAGTVVEPMSLWPKFPHARVFVHPAAGCTLIESFYQSLRCPLQILIIGEPLASPWGAQSTVSFRGLADGAVMTNRQTVTAEILARNGELFSRYLFLLDGRTAQPPGRNPAVTLDPAALRPGRHTLRVVAYRVGSVRCQIFSEISFEVK